MGMSEIAETLQRGKRALAAAEAFLDQDLATAANRAYIAGENISIALLAALQGSASTAHGQIWKKIDELNKQGLLKVGCAALLETSYRLRLRADYGKLSDMDFNKNSVLQQINQLKLYLKEAEEILKSRGVL